MKVKLSKKIAETVNGVDLSKVQPGDVLDVSEREAAMLLAERWAVSVQEQPKEQIRKRDRPMPMLGRAADAPRKRTAR